MCGIAGVFDLEARRGVDPQLLQRMTDAISHRGPDDEGHHIEDGVALGARRLSIIDLGGGHQPISNEDGSIWVAFNGELFDYPDLQKHLVAQGHRLATRCDTELVVHLWEEQGEAFFEQLKGQFAFSLWDSNSRTLILARDRVGIAPLYYAQQDGYLIWGSEIKAILASGMIRAAPDVRGLDHIFAFFCPASSRSFFEGISYLPPGHYLKVKNGRVHVKRYWDLDFPDRGQELRHRDDRDFTDALLDLLEKAVERRLRADVPVVSYLSGGVDSAIVVALTTRHRGRPTPTFTISLNEAFLDEHSAAAETARATRAHPTVVRCNYERIASAYPRLIEAAEGPVLDTSCACLLLQAQTVHEQGYKVALTGEGADEALAGYFWFKSDRIRRWIQDSPLQWLQPALGALSRKVIGSSFLAPTDLERRRMQDIFGCYPAKQDEYNFFSLTRDMFYDRDMWDRLDGHTAYDDLQFDVDRIKRWDPLNQSLYFGYKMMLAGLLLNQKGDRVAMHSSVETRYPFLDEDVIQFCAQVDPRLKLNRFKEKYLLRRVGRRVLPSPLANRPKHMFRAPLADNFFGPNRPDFARELVSRENLQRTGYFDADAVHRAIREYPRRRRFTPVRSLQELGLVNVMAVQLWHHRFIDQHPMPELSRREAARAQARVTASADEAGSS